MKFSRYELENLISSHGDKEIRTLDPLLARQVLSQLSYVPRLQHLKHCNYYIVKALVRAMGLSGLEPPTSRLSGVRSNQSRQPPIFPCRSQHSTFGRPRLNRRVRDVYGCFPGTCPHRQRQWGLLGLHCLTYLYNGYASSTGCFVQPLNGPRPYFVSLAGLSGPLPGSLLALPLERR